MIRSSTPRKKLSFCRTSAAVAGFFLVNALTIGLMRWAGFGMPGASVEQDVQITNLGQSPMYGSWSWWTAHGYFETEKPPDLVVMGSSLINSAAWAADALTLWRPIDCALHHKVITMERALARRMGLKDVSVVNCSIGGAVASDYYVMCKALMSGSRKPKILVLGIAPRDFIDNSLESPATTEPFMFFSRYVDIDSTVGLAYGNIWERAMGELENRVTRLPMRRLHALVVGFLNERKESTPAGNSGNQLLAAISNGQLNVKPGDLIVPFNPTPTWYDNSAEYQKRYQNPHTAFYDAEMVSFEETLKTLSTYGIKVLVVEMPTLASNRKLLSDSFWKEYIAQISGICRRTGADFLNLSDSKAFAKADFVDTVHLNWHGGRKVFEEIAAQISLSPELSAVLTGKTTSVAGKGSQL